MIVKILSALLYIVVGLFSFVIILLLATAITGHTQRSYETLNSTDTVMLDGKNLSVAEIAEIYHPLMYLRSTTPSPALLWIWYESVPTETSIDLIYYFTWENEINPNPSIHRLYSLFRAAYYGYPLYDVEYFQVSISRSDGVITRIRFETSPVDDFFTTVSEHIVVKYELQPDGTYAEYRYSRSGALLSSRMGITVCFENHHVLAGVQTWDHLSRLLSVNDLDFIQVQQTQLKQLIAREYALYKFVRKSQGDHRTIESPITLLVTTLTVTIFLVIPINLFEWYRRLKHTRIKRVVS